MEGEGTGHGLTTAEKNLLSLGKGKNFGIFAHALLASLSLSFLLAQL